MEKHKSKPRKPGWTELGGGAEGAQAPPPSFLDLYSKNFKISQIREEIFFSI